MAYPAYLFSNYPHVPNLFQCEKNGKSFLLFGTYHVMPLSVIPDEYLEIMKKPERLILESIHKPRTEASLIQAGLIYATEKEQDENAFQKLTPAAREILLKALRLFASRHNLPAIPLTRVVPERAIWFARFCVNYGSMDSCLEKLGFPVVLGLEEDESIVFDTTTVDELNNILEVAFGCLKDPPEYPDYVLEPMDQYLTGDSLSNTYYCGDKEQDEFVWRRNEEWMPKILRHHAEGGNALIAVGHTHLVSTKGLLYLLQQAKFKITQYKASEKIFAPFMPDLLFEPISENYAFAKRIEIVLDTLLENSWQSACALEVNKPGSLEDILKPSKNDTSAKFLQTYLSLPNFQSTVYSLVMEYCEPVAPIVFSKIYPGRSKELVAQGNQMAVPLPSENKTNNPSSKNNANLLTLSQKKLARKNGLITHPATTKRIPKIRKR